MIETQTPTFIEQQVLIKEVRGGRQDRIFSVKGLPRHFLYDTNGRLHRGITVSLTGDGAFVFWTDEADGETRLKTIDNYIRGIYPRFKVLPERITNAKIKGDLRSGPLSREELEERFFGQYGVRYVDLPMPDSEIPDFKEKTSDQVTLDSYKRGSHFRSDTVEPKKAAPVVKSNLMCVICDYTAKSTHALKIHSVRKHGSSNNKGAN